MDYVSSERMEMHVGSAMLCYIYTRRSIQVLTHPSHSLAPMPENWGVEDGLSEVTTLPYSSWLPKWTSNLQKSTVIPQIPSRACLIQTPLCPTAWQAALQYYLNKQLTQFFLDGITRGFQIGYNHFSGKKLKSARNICKEPYNIQLSWTNTSTNNWHSAEW